MPRSRSSGWIRRSTKFVAFAGGGGRCNALHLCAALCPFLVGLARSECIHHEDYLHRLGSWLAPPPSPAIQTGRAVRARSANRRIEESGWVKWDDRSVFEFGLTATPPRR